MPEDQAQPQLQAPEVPETPDLGGLWDKLKAVGGKAEGGLEQLWSHLKSGEKKQEAFGHVTSPEEVARRDVEDIQSGKLPGGRSVGEAAMDIGTSMVGSIGRGPGIPGVARTTPLPPSAQPGLADLARGVSHAIETTVSPTTVDQLAQGAEALIDKGLGHARRQTTIANAEVEKFRPLSAPMIEPFQRYTQETHANLRSGLPPPTVKPDALILHDYMEGRSTGAALPPQLAHLQPLADTLRKLYKERAAAIMADPLTNITSLIDDYVSHQWRERPTSNTFLYGGRPRMGSGGPLKKRTIPTISEGIDLGLTPTSFDPIETAMRSIANMDRFLASNEIFAAGQNAGAIKFHPVGQAPPGWAQLKGRLAGPNQYGMAAHAPEGFARVYNNSAHVDPGWAGSPVYQGLNQGKNALTQALLGFSGYHYLAMAQEASVNRLSAALGDLKAGDFAEAAKKAGLAVTAPITQLSKGAQLKKAYLKQLPPSPANQIYDKVANLAEGAGGRLVGRGEEWRGSAMDDYWTAIRRGTLGPGLRSDIRDVTSGPLSTMPFRAAGMAFREAGRLMETLNKLLFDHIVPNLKGAAFFDEMEGWLRQNPNASHAEELAQARLLWDAVDDRFGEMVMDRVFWNQRLKQTLQLMMVSPGWELGSARALGGGLADAARGQFSPRTRWLLAFPPTVALSNAVYQYLRTGKSPDDPTDVIAPQTGGRTSEGKPERAILPGYEKDPLGWFHDPGAKLGGMINPAARGALGGATKLMTGSDPFQFGASPGDRDIPGHWKAWANRIMQSFEPIPLQQMGRAMPGSALGPASNVMGIRPAPGYITDPARTKAISQAVDERNELQLLRSQQMDARRRGDQAKLRELQRQISDKIREQRGTRRELRQMRPGGLTTQPPP